MNLSGARASSQPETSRIRGGKKRGQKRLKRLQRKALEPGADFELWYGDGVRFELLPVSRSMWRRRGTILYVPTPGTNVRVPVCGAFRYPDGPFLFSHGPKDRHVNTRTFLDLLELLVARAERTGRRIILVLDHGSAFTSGRALDALARATRIHVRWLPYYTSEQLNLIEPIWGHLKDTYFSRMLTTNEKDFYPAIVGILRNLCPIGAFRAMLRPGGLPTARRYLRRSA